MGLSSTYNFVKFVVNGTDASGPSFNLTVDNDYTIEAVYQIAAPPPDILIETYRGFPIWQSAITGLFYVKNAEGVIIRDLLESVAEARAWIDSYAPPATSSLPILVIGSILGGIATGIIK